jgi:hypothetical protein
MGMTIVRIVFFLWRGRDMAAISKNAMVIVIAFVLAFSFCAWKGKVILAGESSAELEKKAAAGDAEAMYRLGDTYRWGFGVEKNAEKASEWYTKAAEKGNAGAMDRLGGMYAEGQGVEKNAEKAVEWYTKAAEKGNGFAKEALEKLKKAESAE